MLLIQCATDCARGRKMLYGILMVVSVASMVTQNGLQNSFGKSKCKSGADINFYNAFMYAVCVLIFWVLAVASWKISLYTVLMALGFGAITAIQQYYKVVSFSSGPMHVTTLLITASMLIPTLSGPILFPETEGLKPLKLVFAAILVFFLYLSAAPSDKGEKKKIAGRWIFAVAITFLFQGLVGVMQKIHQSSIHKDELFAFLAISFTFSLILSIIRSKGAEATSYFKKSTYVVAILSGVCTFAMNYINLWLSGIIPTQIFFPAINGSSIIFTALVSVFLFKEKMTIKQLIGIIGGMLCLIAIVLV